MTTDQIAIISEILKFWKDNPTESFGGVISYISGQDEYLDQASNKEVAEHIKGARWFYQYEKKENKKKAKK